MCIRDRHQTVRTSLAQLDQERRSTKPEVARSNRARGAINGCVAERPIAAACKAVSHGTRWFESIRTHQPYRASSTGRAAASKAEGSRFDSVVRCQTSRRSQVVEGGGLQSRRRKPASVRIGSSSPGLVSSADESGRLLPGGSAVRIGHEAPVHFPDSADGRAPGC